LAEKAKFFALFKLISLLAPVPERVNNFETLW